MLMGITIVGAALIAVANLVADVALERLDPRAAVAARLPRR
jgi:ABC-type dipeptide/oligopeptide/nickel transport system permease component